MTADKSNAVVLLESSGLVENTKVTVYKNLAR